MVYRRYHRGYGGQLSKGWYTIVESPTGLKPLKLSDKEVKLVRLLGGALTDAEEFSWKQIENYREDPHKRFVQFKTYRMLVTPRLCECQHTGWKGSKGET